MSERLELNGSGFRLGWYFLGWFLLFGVIAFMIMAGETLAGVHNVFPSDVVRIVRAARFVFAPAALISVAVNPWVAVAYKRWFINRLRTDAGPVLTFGGRVSGVLFAAFIGYSIIAFVMLLTHSWLLSLLFDFVVLPAGMWCYLCWQINNTTVGGTPLRMDYRKTFAFTWRYFLTMLSTFIGWIWTVPWLMRWTAKQVSSEYGDFSCTLTAGRFFKYGFITFVCSLGVVTYPWAIGYLYRRLLNQVEIERRLEASAAE